MDANLTCLCRSLDKVQLRATLPGELKERFQDKFDSYFSEVTVFVKKEALDTIESFIQQISRVLTSSVYRRRVQEDSLLNARHDWGTRGVFGAYDFHLIGEQPKLIEINTNAGGYFLHALLTESQKGCCGSLWKANGFEEEILSIFEQEWVLQKRNEKLRIIAIVDEAPQDQHFYPEFLLFQSLFERAGYRSIICAPDELNWNGEKVKHRELEIDLVYNRHTDFYLQASQSYALLKAFEHGGAVITPNPYHHLLQANKRNLSILTNLSLLQECGLRRDEQELIRTIIPESYLVKDLEPEKLWTRRKEYFFKPYAGHGSKATYRGDKITRRVWSQIVEGKYIAQKIIPPSTRLIDQRGTPMSLKFDLRAYTYGDKIIGLVARLYSGQTTNLRTPGGGLAPVAVL